MQNASEPWYVSEGQRGEQLLEQGRVEPARSVFENMLTRLGSSPSYTRAVVLGRLARCWQIAQRVDLAERYLREALGVTTALPPSNGVKALRGTLRSDLGDVLRAAGQYRDARAAYEMALTTARELNDMRGQAVELGRLGALAAAEGDAQEAATCFESARRLFEQAGDTGHLARCLDALANLLSDAVRELPELAHHVPAIVATLGRLGVAPSYGRAVILGQLGRCWWMATRLDLAVPCLHEALGVVALLRSSDDVAALGRFLQADLGDMLRAAGRDDDARAAYDAAPPHDPVVSSAITVYDDVTIDHVFEPDLLVEGPRLRRVVSPPDAPVPDDARPVILPSVRVWADEDGAVVFKMPITEPRVERDPGCTVLRRSTREVRVAEQTAVVWRVMRAMDGSSTVADIIAGFPAEQRAAAARVLAALAGAGVVDATGRPLGRFVHLLTKKGVLPAGGLEGEAILQLATDGNYRAYPGAPCVPVGTDVPERLRTFHALTRSRRSSREYGGAVARADLDAMLYTACGVTGRMAAAGREVQLRAYPSSGALYAVEIYPVVFRIDGLEPAVYHYRAPENVLELVRPALDPAGIVRAALPMERDMVAGAAALVCLTGCFPRHERKYGEGGYRMLVAEAGHISQNLVLAATALGLRARPFGGVFDDLLNQDLGLGGDEQFLLAVLVGSGGGA